MRIMDIQKIISDVLGKLQGNDDLIKKFTADPVKTLEGLLNIDLPDEQINKIIEGVKGQIDFSKIDVKEAAGLLGKLKSLFNK